MNTMPTSDIPNARTEYRQKDWQPYWIIVTAHRTGTEEPATVEMNLDQWVKLPTVQYVVKLELSQKQPRCPREMPEHSLATQPVPHSYIKWRDGRNWVILTAYRAGTQDPVTVEMTLGQWFALKPVQHIVDDGLEGGKSRREPLR
jgi:hypothetical protein